MLLAKRGDAVASQVPHDLVDAALLWTVRFEVNSEPSRVISSVVRPPPLTFSVIRF